MSVPVEVAVPEVVYQVVRGRAEIAAPDDEEPGKAKIGEYLLDYLDFKFRWVHAETGEVIVDETAEQDSSGGSADVTNGGIIDG